MPEFDPATMEPPQEIVPGLWRLRTPMLSEALPWVMPYAFRGRHGVTLFDAGYDTPDARAGLTAQLRAIGFAPSDVQRLIVSHAHADHIGMADWLRSEVPGLEVSLIGREVDWWQTSHHAQRDWYSRESAWMLRHGISREEVEAGRHIERIGTDERQRPMDAATATERSAWEITVTAERRLTDGEMLEFDGWRLQAVWTPGHTPGHLCAYLPDHRLTFTGDHVLSRITPNVSLSSGDEEAGRHPLQEFLASLRKVAALDTALALPAHEATIPDLRGRCAEIIEHHDHRLAEVIGALEGGLATAEQIAQRVTWNRPYSTFGPMKKHSAIGETLSHLDLLRVEGRVRMHQDDDGLIHWERSGVR